MRRSASAVALLASLTGCATTYQDYTGQDAACIKGDFANFIKYFSEGEAHVIIQEIDGVPTRGNKPFCFAPGKHRLRVLADTSNRVAEDYVDLDFEAGRKYLLRANFREIAFVCQVMDITTPPGTKVGEFSLKSENVKKQIYIPTFVPAK